MKWYFPKRISAPIARFSAFSWRAWINNWRNFIFASSKCGFAKWIRFESNLIVIALIAEMSDLHLPFWFEKYDFWIYCRLPERNKSSRQCVNTVNIIPNVPSPENRFLNADWIDTDFSIYWSRDTLQWHFYRSIEREEIQRRSEKFSPSKGANTERRVENISDGINE